MSVASEILEQMNFGDDDPDVIDASPSSTEPEPQQAPEVATETVEPETEPEGEPAPVDPEAAQEFVIPHGDTRYPEAMWNRPVSDIVKGYGDLDKSYREAVRKINEQGAEKNAALQQAQIFQIAFNKLQQQQPPPQPQNQYGYEPDDEIWQNPQKVLADTARIAREQAIAEVAPRLQALEFENQKSAYEKRVDDVRQTAERARVHLGVDTDTWENRARLMVSLAEFGELKPTDFDSWVQNYERSFPRPQAGAIPQRGTVRGSLPGAVKPSAMSAPTGRKVAVRPDAIMELLQKSHPLFKNQPDEYFAEIAEEMEANKETRS